MSVSKLRIGKDITIKMSVLTNGEPVSLDGRDISVVLKTPMCQEVKLGFTTEDNVITTKYEGTKQKYCGMYMITVWENYGKIGQTALDFCNAFELVSSTCKEVPSSDGLETEAVNLEGDLNIGIQGPSAYEVALNNGFEGTEAEWLESLKGKDFTYEDFTEEQIAELQRPATEAAQIASDATTKALEATSSANEAAQSARQAATSADHATTEANEAIENVNATNTSVTEAESSRVQAETQRQQAEASRQSAETERESTFATLSGEVEQAVNKANSAVIEAEGALETAQQASTLATEAAESANQAASNATTAAQTATEAAQSASQTEASIEQAEALRVTAEDQRKAKESERESAEESRKQAESGRVTAEQGRVSAESGRATAEQNRASAEQQRVAEFTQLKQDAETATTNANEASENANQAASGITDRLSETYPNFAAIEASGETNQNKIYIDAETNTSYRYDGSEFVSIGGGGSFPTKINAFNGNNIVTIPFNEKLSLKKSEWITIVWDRLKKTGSDTNTFFEYKNSNRSNYITISKSGGYFDIEIKGERTSNKPLCFRLNYYGFKTFNLLSINMNDLSLIAFVNGVKTIESAFSTLSGVEYSKDLIEDSYDSIIIGKSILCNSSVVGILNYKMTDVIASDLYRNGSYYKNPIYLNQLANGFDWDIINFLENLIYSNNFGSTIFEDGVLKCTNKTVSNNVYLVNTNTPIPQLYRKKRFDIEAKIRIVSGEITMSGFGLHGRIRCDIYSEDGDYISKTPYNLTQGSYILKALNKLDTTNQDAYILRFNVVETGEMEISELKSRLSGYAISCATSQISGNVCNVNNDTQKSFEGNLLDDDIILETLISDSTNVEADFAGQHLIVGEDVYVAIKGGQKLWKKITS